MFNFKPREYIWYNSTSNEIWIVEDIVQHSKLLMNLMDKQIENIIFIGQV